MITMAPLDRYLLEYINIVLASLLFNPFYFVQGFRQMALHPDTLLGREMSKSTEESVRAGRDKPRCDNRFDKVLMGG